MERKLRSINQQESRATDMMFRNTATVCNLNDKSCLENQRCLFSPVAVIVAPPHTLPFHHPLDRRSLRVLIREILTLAGHNSGIY